MIPLPTHTEIFLYAHPADMRKSFCGLAGIVREQLGREPQCRQPVPVHQPQSRPAQGAGLGL